jgi:hypothetical protein
LLLKSGFCLVDLGLPLPDRRFTPLNISIFRFELLLELSSCVGDQRSGE